MRALRGPIGILVAACLEASVASLAFAGGPYTDEMSKCLVRGTTDADRTLLVQWIFAMATLHPAVKSMSAVPDAERSELNRKIAGLMEHLLTVSCQSEARQALKFEGNGALEESFNVLGQVAGRELFANPQVASGMAGLEKYLDSEKLKRALLPSK